MYVIFFYENFDEILNGVIGARSNREERTYISNNVINYFSIKIT